MLPLRVLLKRANKIAGLKPTICRASNIIQFQPSIYTLSRLNSTQYYIESPFPKLTIPDITLDQYILNNVDNWPENTAMVCGVTGRKYSYGQMKVLSKRVALALLKAGFKPGQVITLILPNIPEFLIAITGALQAGLIVSTVNPLYSSDEIQHQLDNSESVCVITYSEKVNDVNEAISKIKTRKFHPIIVINNPSEDLPNNTRSFREILENGNNDDTILNSVNKKADDTAFLLYSSGTTGLPKGVILTHRQVLANCLQTSVKGIKLANSTTKTAQDTIICILPFFHIYGLTLTAITNLNNGSKLITLPKFEPQTFLSTLKDYQIKVAYLVPPLIQFLANHPAVSIDHIDSLRSICNGAAAISRSDAEKLLSKKKLILVSGYGMTEASPVITATETSYFDLDTVGWPLSNSQMKIVDCDSGEIIDPSKSGEICVKGPQVMSGYLKNEEATRATIKDGWLHTGDVGYFGKDGNLYIVDRLKELIKVKGFQVAPIELEETLRNHPDIGDVAVVGKPHDRYGEVPVAFIVPKQGRQPSAKDIQDFVASKVAEYKQISSVIFLSEIPKNTTGKILRKNLKASLLQK